MRQTGKLVRAEASLATAELREDAVGALLAAVTAIAGIVMFSLALACGVAAAFLIAGMGVLAALLATGGVLAAIGGITGIVCIRIAPKRVIARSRERVASKIHDIEDHAQ